MEIHLLIPVAGLLMLIIIRCSILLLPILLSSSSGRLIAKGLKRSKPTTQERIINVDFSKTAGPLNAFFKECVGAGRANEGLRADWQQQLAYEKKECGYRQTFH